MRVLSRPTIRAAQAAYPEAADYLGAWLAEAEKANWQRPWDVKAEYPTASIIRDNRVVFNIRGNSHRLLVHVNYDAGIVFVKFFGTHREYDRIDAETYGRPKH